MKFTFHPEARIEFIEAIAFYESCRMGLGLRFSREVHATINRITLRPAAWPQISQSTRRCISRRFPYGLIYEVQDDTILIIAVSHLNREPGYWKKRVK